MPVPHFIVPRLSSAAGSYEMAATAGCGYLSAQLKHFGNVSESSDATKPDAHRSAFYAIQTSSSSFPNTATRSDMVDEYLSWNRDLNGSLRSYP